LRIEVTMKSKAIFTLIVLVPTFGCTKPSDNVVTSDAPIVMDDLPPVLDQHAHPEHGPHGGELIELGKEAFHGELVRGQGGIAIFVLDSSATKPVPIASEKLTVSLKHEGQVKTFDLAANPDTNDPADMTSRFTSSDPQLGQWMDAGAEGAVVIQIEGKSFTGKISHDHDHDHGDHAGHNH
jgi:hypothetical protein